MTGNRLEQLIEDRKYSQKTTKKAIVDELRKLLNVSERSIWRWTESGEIPVKYHDIIASYFSVTEEWLRTGKPTHLHKVVGDIPSVNTPGEAHHDTIGKNPHSQAGQTGAPKNEQDSFTDHPPNDANPQPEQESDMTNTRGLGQFPVVRPAEFHHVYIGGQYIGTFRLASPNPNTENRIDIGAEKLFPTDIISSAFEKPKNKKPPTAES